MRPRSLEPSRIDRLPMVLAMVMTLTPVTMATAQVQWRPATAVLITYDRSASMDFAALYGEIPLYPPSCNDLLASLGSVSYGLGGATGLGQVISLLPVEYARTRHSMGVEALTGSFINYCPEEVLRPAQADGRDAEVLWPHSRPHFTRQRSDGLLDVYADTFFFGFATYDALMNPSLGLDGDYSFGPAYLPNGQIATDYGTGVNLGLANAYAPVGAMVSPLPRNGFTARSGSVMAFRLWNNALVQQRIAEVIPGLESPLAAALDDVQVFRNSDPSHLVDPFDSCRPVAHLLLTDGQSTWDICRNAAHPPTELRCSEYPYDPAVTEAEDLALGQHCSVCEPGDPAHRVPSYVLSFATDETNLAEDIAGAGGTCAVVASTGECIQHAFYAEDHAGAVSSLGTIFNNVLGGVTSSIPSLTSTVTGSDGIGLVRFRAGARVSLDSPFWTGTLTRELFRCQSAQSGEEPTLTLASTVDFADAFVPDKVPLRNIYFGRPDLLSSCDSSRLSCRFFDYSCGDTPGAVADPSFDSDLSDFGDGTGGIWSGGALSYPPTPDAQSRQVIDANLTGIRDSAVRRVNDDPLPQSAYDLDFALIDYNDDCLIEFNSNNTFFAQEGMAKYLGAENFLEVQGITSFVRGATLESLATMGTLLSTFDATTVALRDRPSTGYLGDFYHSTMAFSDRPSRSDQTTPGYLEFVQNVGAESPDPRPYTLYIGGNDGMLHAFDALTGNELWGIIPPSFLPHLRDTLLSHRVLVDGPVTVKDLRCEHTLESEQWCTLLAVSYRSGGSGVMVLDVTDSREPRFLFEITGRHLPELGLGYPQPLLANMVVGEEERPVLILSGGEPLNGIQTWVESAASYGLAGSHEGEILVVLDAVTGEIYRQFDPVSHPELFRTCGPVTGSPAGWSQTQLTRVFAGTQQGCLLRFNLGHADPTEWTAEILSQTANENEIAFAPALATRWDGTVVAVYGQGNNEQFENVNQQSSLISVNESRVLVPANQTTATAATYAYEGTEVNFELMFETGEFLTTRPIISDGIIYFATWVPDHDDACNFGSARVYGIDYLGDPDVGGNVPGAPYRVDVTSDRIVGRMKNPLYDSNDPDSPYLVKYIDHSVLGDYSIVFALAIELVPSCETVRVDWQGYELNVAAGAVQRQLQVDRVNVTELQSAEGGWVDTSSSENAFSVISIGQDLARPEVVAVPLDWGVIMEF